jgi:ATP adenylyltransferase
VTLDRLWAGWRQPYLQAAVADTDGDECLFCRLFAAGDDRTNYVVARGERWGAVLNAYPYTSGHVMVAPLRHVGEMEALRPAEATALWAGVTTAVRALKGAYGPDGINVGLNLGRAAGAGVPGHLHVHVLPRWEGDANFMTSAAEVRVLPEALPDTWTKLTAAWPSADGPVYRRSR